MASPDREVKSSDSSNLWDVFLSFRGEDTRLNFMGHLYKALSYVSVRTFMDDPELQSGEEISPALLQAIKESNIYIVVFSENYATSRWCLDELVNIMECGETFRRLVIPVFYKVNPADVRYQVGSFKHALEKHQKRYMNKMDKWRLALTEAAEFSGYHIDETTSEADIIEKVVERILHEINPIYLNVAKHPVGLDMRVKEITQLLSTSVGGVHTIGIYGMGGVGKTTLAKAAYNQNFDRFQGSCFLANISEFARQPKGIESLQEQLICDVLKGKKFNIDNIDRGISIIRQKICSKRVLIVLDGLDHPEQLDYLLVKEFASGSAIIVTTRDEGLLETVEVKDRYMVTKLDDVDSLELFTQHAFGQVKPSDIFTLFSKEILHHAGGLPLALVVFGSNLFNQHDIGYWGNFIEKLLRIPNNNIQEKLMISFDALDDDMLRNIFLDIACFFIGEKKDDIVTKLDTCYSYSNYKIKILEKRCLVTVNNNNELWMHNLLQDMGRQIAREKSFDEPGEYNRLWDYQDICDVLTDETGTEAIEGIVPHPRSYNGTMFKLSLSTETFKRMPKLRFLYMEDVNLTGSFKRTLKNLRWLHWYGCPSQNLPSDFCPQKLVILELPFSRLNRLWDHRTVLEKLKILDLSGSFDFTTAPDFSGLACLEKLILQGCKSLLEVGPSIGCLTKLVYLDLGGCKELRSLPSRLCDLKALEYLDLNASLRLQELPEELGKMERLRVVNLRHTDIRRLPGSICNLRALESLDVGHCFHLKELPLELGNIKSLVKLDASETAISNMPNSIGCLRNLIELKLEYNSNLETLPNTVCNLRSLEFLDISYCSKLEGLPNELGMMERLRELHSVGNSLSGLAVIGSLSSLRHLNLSHNDFSALPPSISQLPNLESLRVTHCIYLESIEKLPLNLKELHLDSCTVIEKIPDLCNLKQLEILDVTDCPSLTEIQGSTKLHIKGCQYSSIMARRSSKISSQKLAAFGNRTGNHLSETEIPPFPYPRTTARMCRKRKPITKELASFDNKTGNHLSETEILPFPYPCTEAKTEIPPSPSPPKRAKRSEEEIIRELASFVNRTGNHLPEETESLPFPYPWT